MRAVTGMWRWRHNPLRRATDLVEAWVALAALLLIVLAAPAAGWSTGALAHGALHKTMREQQEQRHRVTATVVRAATKTAADPDPETFPQRDAVGRVVATWRAPDGTRHTDSVRLRLRQAAPGGRIPVWTDRRGRLVPQPMDSSTAATHAVLAGVGAFAAVGALAEVARRLVVRQLMRRRFDAWDRAWAQAGPDCGRTGTGS
nr:hypothetical protein [Streptomyces sp. GC420]